MNYVAHRARPNPAALAGALGVPAAIAGLLVAGLAVTVVAPDLVPNPEGTFIEEEVVEITPIDRPEKPIDPATNAQRDTPRAETSFTTIPDAPVDLGTTAPIDTLPPLGGEGIGTLDPVGPIPAPLDPVIADAVAPLPKGDPGRWITDRDYRTRWIREGLSGTARFALAIDASGRISECTITRSSGHGELDAATCRLIERRARFEPARDAEGNRVPGRYSNAINWRIPE